MQLEVKEGIKIEIHNKSTGRGYYYAEDDWSIKAVATTYKEAIELIIPEYINSGIYPSGKYISDVKYVTYNDKQYIIYDSDKTPPTLIYNNALTDIIEHSLFKKLSEEKHKKLEANRAIRKIKIEKQNEISERNLLEKLREKYDKVENKM